MLLQHCKTSEKRLDMGNVKSRMRRLIAVVMTALMALSICACGSAAKDKEAIQALVETTFQGLGEQAAADPAAYLGQDRLERLASYGVDGAQFMQAALANLTYTLDEVVLEDEANIAKLTISNVNLDDAMAAALDEFDAWLDTDEAVSTYKESGEEGLYAQLFSLFYQQLDQLKEKAVTTQVDLAVQKQEDGTWVVASEGNDAFYDALLGGATFAWLDGEA